MGSEVTKGMRKVSKGVESVSVSGQVRLVSKHVKSGPCRASVAPSLPNFTQTCQQKQTENRPLLELARIRLLLSQLSSDALPLYLQLSH